MRYIARLYELAIRLQKFDKIIGVYRLQNSECIQVVGGGYKVAEVCITWLLQLCLQLQFFQFLTWLFYVGTIILYSCIVCVLHRRKVPVSLRMKHY